MSMTWERLGSMLLEETGNTLLMTLPATFFAYLIGLPLGVLLVITRKDGILPKPTLNRIIGVIVNLLRSVPFIILMVMLFPATRAILGRGTGTVSIIIPLTVSAFPYVARMVEGSLLEVDNGVVEAAQAMGSTTFQIVRKVLIPEAMPSLVNGFAICITTILGYTAMAGTAGGDGLGKVAITYGLNKRQYDVMYAASIVLVLLAYLGVIASGVCFFLWNYGARRVTPVKLAIMNNLKIPLAAMTSLLLFREYSNMFLLSIGCLLILASFLIVPISLKNDA